MSNMDFNDESFAKIEFQTDELFRQAGWKVNLVTNHERIDIVVNKAIIESVVRDTSTFFFVGFSSALTGLSSAFFGSAISSDSDYRA